MMVALTAETCTPVSKQKPAAALTTTSKRTERRHRSAPAIAPAIQAMTARCVPETASMWESPALRKSVSAGVPRTRSR